LANEALGQLEDMYQHCIKDKNYKQALEVRKEINKLTGLYESEKIDFTGEIIFKAKFDDI
jgi:protein-arginine kinase activator protein McsA